MGIVNPGWAKRRLRDRDFPWNEKDTASGKAEGGVEDLNGAYRARTGDLLLAKQLLSQLS